MSQDDLRAQWFDYIYDGNVKGIEEMIKDGFDVETKDDDGYRKGLSEACENGFLEIVQVLLDAGVDVNGEELEETPLGAAANKNRIDVVELLIENGADVNGRDWNGNTPLMHANAEVAKVLIEHGADVHAQNDDGEDVFSCALSNKCMNTVMLLLENGVKTTKEHLNKASSNQFWDFVKLLVDQGMDGNNCMDDWGGTPLKRACWAGRMDIVKALVNNGTDVNEGEGGKPLDDACRGGHVDIARFLVENGAEINLEDNDTVYSMITASRRGYLDIVRLLLDMGVDVNGCDRWRKTALIEACKNDQVDCVRLLLNHGADVNVKDGQGNTPLMIADAEVAKVLIEHGADVNAKNKFGDDALLMALGSWHLSTAIVLLENGVKTTKEHLKKASERNQWDFVKLLVDQGMDGNNCMENWGGTPLKTACRVGRMDIVKALVNNGTDVNEGKPGKPFDSACWNGHLEIARFLVENGAEVDWEDNETVYSMITASGEGYLDIVRLLLDMGVDLNGRDRWVYSTALIQACRSGHAECVKLLLNHGADVNAEDVDGKTAMDWARKKVEVVKILEENPKKWCKEDHWSYPIGFKDAVKEVMLMWMHDQYDDDELNGFEWNMLPWEVIERILGWLGRTGRDEVWRNVGSGKKKREREMDEVEKEEDEEETQPERKKRRNEEWKSP